MNTRQTSIYLAMIGGFVIADLNLGPVARAGSITYNVTVDTSSLVGTTGGIEFTLIAGNTPAPLDTATITKFVPQAGLVPPPTTSGDVSGNLSTTVSLDNQSPSMYFESLTYGHTLSYQVTLTGAGLSKAADTLFSFYLFDSVGNPVSGPSSPSGEILDINIQGPTGVIDTPVTYPPPPITVTTASVPELSGVVLLGVGLGAMAG
jgi:hypothetical protein